MHSNIPPSSICPARHSLFRHAIASVDFALEHLPENKRIFNIYAWDFAWLKMGHRCTAEDGSAPDGWEEMEDFPTAFIMQVMRLLAQEKGGNLALDHGFFERPRAW